MPHIQPLSQTPFHPIPLLQFFHHNHPFPLSPQLVPHHLLPLQITPNYLISYLLLTSHILRSPISPLKHMRNLYYPYWASLILLSPNLYARLLPLFRPNLCLLYLHHQVIYYHHLLQHNSPPLYLTLIHLRACHLVHQPQLSPHFLLKITSSTL